MRGNLWRRAMHTGLLVAIVAGGLGGCASGRVWWRGDACAVVPVDVSALPAEMNLRARMRVVAASREVGFDVVVQRSVDAEELRVVGLALPGTRLFALRQVGRDFILPPETDRVMRSLAAWTMDALHRGLFVAPPSTVSTAGPIRWRYAGEMVEQEHTEDSWTRTFRPSAGKRNAPVISIEYRPDPDGSRAEEYTIQNPECGYEAIVVLLGSTR